MYVHIYPPAMQSADDRISRHRLDRHKCGLSVHGFPYPWEALLANLFWKMWKVLTPPDILKTKTPPTLCVPACLLELCGWLLSTH